MITRSLPQKSCALVAAVRRWIVLTALPLTTRELDVCLRVGVGMGLVMVMTGLEIEIRDEGERQ